MTRDALVLGNRAIVDKVLKRLRIKRRGDYDDVRGEALLALVKAADSYDPSRGAAFSSWAWLKVSGAVKDWLENDQRLKRHHSFSGQTYLESVPFQGFSAEDFACGSEVTEMLALALHDEPQSVRSLVEAVARDGLSPVDFSGYSSLRPGTLLDRRVKAREALRFVREDLA